MTTDAPAHTCARCGDRLYPATARRTDAGWQHTNGRACALARRRVRAAQRLEDVCWMTETGECLSGAARRLGMSEDALEKWLRDNGRRDLSATLRAREPLGLQEERKRRRSAA